jgi:NAD(P)H-dependent FMN reductase
MGFMHIVAISGSLRAKSNNSALIEAAARLAPDLTIYRGLASLPHFNPDLEEGGDLGQAVQDWRALAERADALVISCPEYARGVPGAFKNALDWLVGDPAFGPKPVALFNASPRGVVAQEALRLILATMGCDIIESACITLPLVGVAYDADGLLGEPAFKTRIAQALSALSSPSVRGSSSPA